MKEIRFNAFLMNCISHLSPGLWRQPGDRSLDYNSLDHWVSLAKTLERGLFDGIFFADILGVYDTYQNSLSPSLSLAAQIPVNDPLPLIPVMAHATEHLGFGLTASVSFEHPFPFARRMSTLDHITRGRVAWNIVTSYLDSAARNLGQERITDHDSRYDMADEYLEVAYKLWEGSWADDAVEGGRVRFADPAKVRPINHQGEFFRVPGVHLCEPSPQRTPVLYQAGSSDRGKRFAARHAECVFTGCPSMAVLRKVVSDIRGRATLVGRAPEDILIFNMQTIVLGRTDDEAKEKYQELQRFVDKDAVLAIFSGAMGIDLGELPYDEPLRYVKTQMAQSLLEVFTVSDPCKEWTVREIVEWCGIGGRGPVLYGSPTTVADQIEHWVAETDVDGFNLSYASMPATYEDVVDLLIPELQARGIYKTTYRQGTLREKLFRAGARLPDSHYAAKFRFSSS
ncbi:LLM class flavin-dependent oxidoreductase [Agrobacterium pusense]|uniref:LLM class flavin-dependent oxidoreductase n=1 Tax=Agrobacterium pusense TaxID=648995 RepID=UPI003FD2703E